MKRICAKLFTNDHRIILNSLKVQIIQSPSTNEWLHKTWFIYTMELVIRIKKEWTDPTSV